MIAAASVLTAAVIAVAYMQASGRSYAYDESLSVGRFISTGPRAALTTQTVFNNHPLFSAVQALLWKAGGTTETWQRTLPVLYAATAAGLMMWAIARRVGMLAGLAAAAVVAANPVFASQGRQVRGYSLAALAVIVGVIALVEYLDTGNRLCLAPHGLAATVGVGTHLYAGIAFACVGVAAIAWLLATRRRPDRLLVGIWAVSALAAAAVYLPTIDEMSEASDRRGSRYVPGFGGDAVRAMLGQHSWSVWALGVVVVGSVVALVLRDRPLPGLAVAGSILTIGAGGVLVIWQIFQPFDLYTRFLVVLIPVTGAACAVAVARWPVLLVPVAVATAAMVSTNMDVWDDEHPMRQAADVLSRAQQQGLVPCVVGGEALAAYAPAPGFSEIGEPHQLPNCGIYVEIGSWGKPLREPAAELFEHQWRIEGRYRVFSHISQDQLAEGER